MAHDIVQAGDLRFRPYLSEAEIQARVGELARDITARHAGGCPLFLVVLKGAFIFAADLLRACRLDCEVHFIQLSSYRGTRSSGRVREVIGLEADLRGRSVIVVEDIIDSGRTMRSLLPDLRRLGPASVEVASLLLKPDILEEPLPIDYLGFAIPARFVIGYGLDYDGQGRNLPGLYQKID